MARIINENNEVIAKREDKSKKIKKKPISKTTLIIGIVLFVIGIIIAIVLIVYFTNDKKQDDDKLPTSLEQYVSTYNQGEVRDLQITIVKSFMDPISNYKGECYVLIYDTTWNTKYSSGSQEYEYYSNIDGWLVGEGKTKTGQSKSSALDAFIGAGIDAHFFIVDYSAVEVDINKGQKPSELVFGNGFKMSLVAAPILMHVSDEYTASEGVGLKTLINEKNSVNDWSKELQRITNVFLQYGNE